MSDCAIQCQQIFAAMPRTKAAPAIASLATSKHQTKLSELRNSRLREREKGIESDKDKHAVWKAASGLETRRQAVLN